MDEAVGKFLENRTVAKKQRVEIDDTTKGFVSQLFDKVMNRPDIRSTEEAYAYLDKNAESLIAQENKTNPNFGLTVERFNKVKNSVMNDGMLDDVLTKSAISDGAKNQNEINAWVKNRKATTNFGSSSSIVSIIRNDVLEKAKMYGEASPQ